MPEATETPKKIPNLRRNLDWLIRSTSVTDVLDELARYAEAASKTAYLSGDEGEAVAWNNAFDRLSVTADVFATELEHQGLLRHPLPDSAPPAVGQPPAESEEPTT